MIMLVPDTEGLFARWAVKQIPHVHSTDELEPFECLGVTTGNEGQSELLAALIYHMYVPQYKTCQLTIASADPRWCSRNIIRGLLSVPFLQYKCNKVWVAVPHLNERVSKFARAIGFRQEAVLKDHFGPGIHAVISRMLKQDFMTHYVPREWREAA